MKRTTPSKNIGSLLPPILLNQIKNRIEEKTLLKALWNVKVALPMAERLLPERFEAGCLHLSTGSAAWATRFRHDQDQILELLRTEPYFFGLKKIAVRVVPRTEGATEDVRPRFAPDQPLNRPTFSEAASRSLRDAAESISDVSLRDALMRLSSRVQRGS